MCVQPPPQVGCSLACLKRAGAEPTAGSRPVPALHPALSAGRQGTPNSGALGKEELAPLRVGPRRTREPARCCTAGGKAGSGTFQPSTAVARGKSQVSRHLVGRWVGAWAPRGAPVNGHVALSPHTGLGCAGADGRGHRHLPGAPRGLGQPHLDAAGSPSPGTQGSNRGGTRNS